MKRVAHIKVTKSKTIKNKFYLSHNVLIYTSCVSKKQKAKKQANKHLIELYIRGRDYVKK